MLFRTLMMLSGDGAKGTLRLSLENGGLRAAIAVSGLPKDAEYGIYLFSSEEKSVMTGQLKNGEWQGTVHMQQDVKACGIVRIAGSGEVFVMTGETGDFDWNKAKSAMYLKRSGTKKPPAEPPVIKMPEVEMNREELPEAMHEGLYAPEPEPPKPSPEIYISEPEIYGNLEEERKEDMPGDFSYDMPQPQQFSSSLEFREPEKFLDAVKESSEEEEDLILRAREAFEETKQDACENCPMTVRKSPIQPFERQYMDYLWEKTEYPGLQGYWHYITGKRYENGVLKKIAIGVPGDYALNPPNWLYGFNTYAYADEGEAKGYWLLFEDA